MKRVKVPAIFLCIFYFASISYGQTLISGGNVSGKWEKSNSPYLVQKNIVVPENLKLKIEPGVEVKFQGHCKLDIKGSIEAIGSPSEFINFTVEDTLGWSNINSNVGGWGGILFNQTQSSDSSKIVFCKFEYGKAKGNGWEEDNAGGAIFINSFSKLIIRNSVFTNNWASWYGGAIYSENANPTFENLLIYNNKAEGNGGGICFESNCCSSAIIVNSTITSNKSKYGGGISCDWGCVPTFYNTIIWDNHSSEGSQVYLGEENADPIFYNCIVEGGRQAFGGKGASLNYNGLYQNCMSVDPLFIDENQNNYQLQNSSYCINTGTRSSDYKYFGKDIAGNNRIYGDCIDIGAYEAQEAPHNRIPAIEAINDIQTKVGTPVDVTISFFDPDSADSHVIEISSDNENVSIEKKNDSINSAIYTLVPKTNWRGTAKISVVVKDNEGQITDQNSTNFNLTASNTIKVGGDILKNTLWNADTIAVISDIIVRDNVMLQIAKGTVVEFQGYFEINVQGAISAIGEQNDSIVFCGKENKDDWAGIKFYGNRSEMDDNDSSKFVNCVFTGVNDKNDDHGGAIYIRSFSKLLIAKCRITKTIAKTGGIVCYINANPRIENNLITYTYGGSGIFCYQSSPNIINNKILYNGVDMQQSYGGGIYLDNSNPQIIGNLIAFNECRTTGGGIFCYAASNPYIVNNTICYNKTTDPFYNIGSGGIEIYLNSSPVISNCIIWKNSNAQKEIQISNNNDNCFPKISYCDIEGGFEGFTGWNNPEEDPFFKGSYEKNIDLDPEFIDPKQLDFSLKPVSPCVDQGNPEISSFQIPQLDLYGNPRIENNLIDMGAVEFQGIFENNQPVIQKVSELDCLVSTSVEMKVIFNDLDKNDTHTISVVSNNPNIQIRNLSGDTTNSTYWVVPQDNWTGSANITVKVTDNKGKENSTDINTIPVIVSNTACGNISGNTVWPKGKISVGCNLTVAENATLTIQSGTTIEFQDFSRIDVYGKLLALGKENDSIAFTVKDTTGYSNHYKHKGWNGIRLYRNSKDTSIITYAKFEYGKAAADNNATGNNGGAIYDYYYKNILIKNCSFKYNNATGGGSAIYSQGASFLILNCEFMHNYCNSGTVRVDKNSKILHSVFAYNTANLGGGIWCSDSVTIDRNKISNNLITGDACKGGGIFCSGGHPTITNNIICNNSKNEPYNIGVGGGIYFTDCNPQKVANNVIYNNQGDRGTAVSMWNSYVTFENSIINGSFEYAWGYPTFLNCDLNSKNEDGKKMTGTGCLSIDPGFVLPSQGTGVQFDALHADWSLLSNSYCINTGNPDYEVSENELDINGNSRVFGNVIDMGAYEYQSVPTNRKPVIFPIEDQKIVQLSEVSLAVKYWDPDLNDTHKISVISNNPHVEIQNLSGDSIGSTFNLVSVDAWEGTAQITVMVTDSSGNQDSTAVSTFNVTVSDHVCGNISNNSVWKGTVKISCPVTIDDNVILKILPGTNIEFAKDASIEVIGTIIAAGNKEDSISFSSSDNTNNWKGISFKNGFYAYGHPSGIMNDNDTTRFSFCKFEYCSNFVLFFDGYSKVIIRNSRFSHNNMSCIKTYEASPSIINNLFEYNAAKTSEAGTIWCERSSYPDIIGNIIRGNEATFGGAINCDYLSDPKIINNLIHDNKAVQGGGIFCTQSNPKIYNNTIVNNNATTGGGIYCKYSTPSLVNSIIWGNSASDQGNQLYYTNGVSNVSNCLIHSESNFNVNANDNSKMIFSLPPNFVDEAKKDFSLSSQSPCINTGTNQLVNGDFPSIDLYGNSRVADSLIDIGAIEFNGVPDNIAPVSIRLSWNSVYENRPVGTVVGILSAIDPNYNDSHVFSLTNSDSIGYSNNLFDLKGDTLITRAKFDYESTTTQLINVMVSDNGGKTYSQNLEIKILNVNEPPEVLNPIPDLYVTINSFFNYTIPENTFFKDRGERLNYSAILANGDQLPSWLNLDSWQSLFYGTPFDYGKYSIALKASDYQYSRTDTFDINVVKNIIKVDSLLVFSSNGDIANVFLPDNIIQNIGKNDNLSFDVFLQNGSPLPEGLTFNPQNYSFTIDKNTFKKNKNSSPTLIDITIEISNILGEKTVIFLTLSYDELTSSFVLQKILNENFVIYPNPNSGRFTLRLLGINHGRYLIKIFGIEGKERYSTSIEVNTNIYTHQFNIESFDRGVYFMTISFGKARITKKFIID